MFVRIDHLMICVPELDAGIAQYRRLGFDIYRGGIHPGKGTHNAIAFNRDDYVELIAIRDQAEYEVASASSRSHDGGLAKFVGIAQPYAAGPAAEALGRRGPGPFQALYRTTSMGAAVRWIEQQAMAPLARGVRNTGEQAMLATPDVAGGAYIGFVGPE